ncbi:MAG TPA: hypothetical protein VGS20_07145 [Candidatus Acidoferrales bacterium]|nr:hypothetical protein [Candidatus Acidoferrales bacterium]
MCSICRHPQLRQIEDDFLDWFSARDISRLYKLPGHATVSRHARAMGLLHKRIKNLHFALGAIIEHVHQVKPNAAAIVSAIRLAAEINSEGERVEPGDRVYLKALFNRMTPEELGAYAGTGHLPAWFREAVGEDAAAPLAAGDDETVS